MSYNTTRVELPDGSITIAELGELTGTGFRFARIRLTDRATVSGRIATTDRRAVKTFQVSLESKNAYRVFRAVEGKSYSL